MRKIIYYVATSIDGFISGPEEDISGFVAAGDGVEQYLADLKSFDTVIMGRRTYEFGYRFGLLPGQPAYPHMKHYIFSNTLTFKNQSELIQVEKPDLSKIKELKLQPGTDIYLCGGGQFAGWLLEYEQIDLLKIKLNPLVLGQGIRLFGNSQKKIELQLLDSSRYKNGVQILSYSIRYPH